MIIDADVAEVLDVLTYLPEEARTWELAEAGRVFTHSLCRADDGQPLHVFEAGDRSNPTLLLVNAVGMSVLFLAAIARELSQQYHVVSWETRGLPRASESGADSDLSLERLAKDGADVLWRLGISQPEGILTYCSGVNVALCGLVRGLFTTRRLCIVSPSIELPVPREETVYQRTMLPIWRDVAEKGASEAALIQRLLQTSASSAPAGLAEELETIDRLPFLTPETTYTYARLQAACRDETVFAGLGTVRLPALVLHCCDDTVIHADTATTLVDALPACSYAEIRNSGHFGIFTSDTIHGTAVEFFNRGRPEA